MVDVAGRAWGWSADAGEGAEDRDGSPIVASLLGAADGAAAGALAGGLVALGAFAGGSLAAAAWVAIAGLHESRDLGFARELLLCAVMAPMLFLAGRRAVLALRWVGREARRRDTVLVALLGAVALLAALLFLVRLPMGTILAAGEVVAIGLWPVGAATTGRCPPVRLTVRRWIAASLIIGVPVFAALGPLGAMPRTNHDPLFDADTSMFGADLPDDLPRPWIEFDERAGVLGVLVDPTKPTPGRWTDLRVELWAAEDRDPTSPFADDRAGEIDARIAGPLRVATLPDAGGQADVRYDTIRGLGPAWAVLTGVHDGTRYVLSSKAVVADYGATLAGWLGSFVPGSPDAVWRVAP